MRLCGGEEERRFCFRVGSLVRSSPFSCTSAARLLVENNVKQYENLYFIITHHVFIHSRRSQRGKYQIDVAENGV